MPKNSVNNQAMGDPVEIQASVDAIWDSPHCSAAHQRFLRAVDKLITHFAWRISLCSEDYEEAVSDLQNRLLEVALPPKYRRVSEYTGRTIAGYDPARVKNTFTFFYGTAKTKSLDILKSRKAAWRRHQALFELLANGAVGLVETETPRDILENRRAGVAAAAAAREPAFGGGTI